MLLVKTKIKESKIHGIGLFADQFIPKGTEIWKFTSGFDQKFTREQILNFPDLLQVYIYKYCWRRKKVNCTAFLPITENTLITQKIPMSCQNIETMRKKWLLLQSRI